MEKGVKIRNDTVESDKNVFLEKRQARCGGNAVRRAVEMAKSVIQKTALGVRVRRYKFSRNARVMIRACVREWADYIAEIADCIRRRRSLRVVAETHVLASLVAGPLHGPLSTDILSSARDVMDTEKPSRTETTSSYSHARHLLRSRGGMASSRAAIILGMAMDRVAHRLVLLSIKNMPSDQVILLPANVLAGLHEIRAESGVCTTFFLNVETHWGETPIEIATRSTELERLARERNKIKSK